VAKSRLEGMARLIGRVKPAAWSEHLAFVRADGAEIGHLAAPPRTPATVEGTLANLRLARTVVGSLPWLENIATLIDPPASTLDEAVWLSAIAEGAGAGLLLDLHNLYANASNFGLDPLAAMEAMPLHRVTCVHVAGGRWITRADAAGSRLLDDHLHDAPDEVLGLLASLAARVPQPLTVIIERDGKYPAMPVLLEQLDLVRAALARGRAQKRPWSAPGRPVLPSVDRAGMVAAQRMETLLAGLYSGRASRDEFLLDPVAAALAAGCAPVDAASLQTLDRDGLVFAAGSFDHKRNSRHGTTHISH
jgi:uncharacterized protein (UPF0276 family)